MGTARLLAVLINRGTADLFPAFDDHPLADDWRDFAWSSLEAWIKGRNGYVYVMVHPLYPGWAKVGRTRLAPENRAKMLTSEGVLGQFALAGAVRAADDWGLERRLHRALATWPRHKEFFLVAWPQLEHEFATQIRRQREDWRRAGFGDIFEACPQDPRLLPWHRA